MQIEDIIDIRKLQPGNNQRIADIMLLSDD